MTRPVVSDTTSQLHKEQGHPMNGKEDLPLVSIVIRSMDRPTLGKALSSVAKQTYPNIEVVVVNAKGGEHADIGHTCGNFNLRVVNSNGPTLNRPAAANFGLRAAAGQYLMFLDDDDWLLADHVAKLANALAGNPPTVLAAHTAVASIDEDGQPTGTIYDSAHDPVRLIFENHLPIHSVLFSRRLLDVGCMMDETLDMLEDWDFWLQVSCHTSIPFVPGVSAHYLIHESSGVREFNEITHSINVRFFQKWRSLWPESVFVNAMYRMNGYHALSVAVSERDSQVASLSQALAERDSLASFNQAVVAERDSQIASLSQALAERDSQIGSLNQGVHDARRELEQVLASKSWQLTKPLRFARRVAVSRPHQATRRVISDNSRALWRNLPVSFESKRRLKDFLFGTFPFAFRWSQAYRAWVGFNSPADYSASGKSPDSQVGLVDSVYVPLLDAKPLEAKPAKLICFYLPQYHPIPENNAWWGEGFTEWTNVQPAQPQFAGHYQPHVPGELGYYNLLDPAVQHRQVELAKLYGIGGFCFYFYWFGGERLLESPIENYLNDSSLDLPFCLCWANENWSRRWDGLDSEILIAQQHSAEDDLAFIQHVARYMRDPRYIRIDGKPLLLVYRPSLLPSARETAARWQNWCRVNGIGEIYLAYTQSFETVNPARYGFDAAIEFPPNNSAPPDITDTANPLGADFGCTVYDWTVFVERSEHYKQPDYTLLRSVCPSWDNTARRKNRGTVFLNNTPALYKRWLENAISDTVANRTNPDERLVFVNAWNEWAEGAHLEPDTRYGYAWLQATRNALSGQTYIPDNQRRIVLVAHDAHPHGAQMLALNLAKTLSQGMGFRVDLVCLGDGPLIAEYAKWATVHLLSKKDPHGTEAVDLAKRLFASGHRIALVNTTVSGLFLETLVAQGIDCVALIHELTGVLSQNKLHGHARAIATSARKIVFPAAEVAESFNDVAPIPADKIVIRPQGLYKRGDKSMSRELARVQLRQKLGLEEDAQIILAAGYADHRKGIDLFVAAGLAAAQNLPNARWVWIGHWEQTMQRTVENQLTQYPDLRDRFIFPGLQADTDLFYGGADVYALTSREDPFPSVVLEALDAGMPVVGFEGAGGFIGLLNEGCGKLVPAENAEAFALAVASLLEKTEEKDALGLRGAALINERFSFRRYVFDLLDLLGMNLARVSVVVPNYNYAQYLPERLGSIIKQDYPVYEILFLDDCSRDESIQVAEKMLHESGIDYRILINEENSGSVFRQWKKGADLASGTHVWLAEADDSCSHGLVSELLKGFRTPGVVLSYCESQQINETGALLANDYLAYVSDVDAKHWLTPFVMDGDSEIANSLSIKNTIPNVSAVLFEKDVLANVLQNHFDLISAYRIAGDWLTYVLVLDGGRVAFSPMPLNKHRRHNSGMTISNINESLLEEIRRMQEYIAEHHGVPAGKVEQARRYIESLQEEHGIAAHQAG
jgi:glycosyltransferase involved in cell wall biosynthesis